MTMKKESLALSILGAEKFLCKVENTLPKLMKLTKQILEGENITIIGKVIEMIGVVCPNISNLVIENYNTTFRQDCQLVRELVDTIPTIELINELNQLKELYLGIRSSSELGTHLNKIRHIASLLDDEVCKIMQYEIRYQLQDTLTDHIGGQVKNTETGSIGTIIEVDSVRSVVEFTEVDEFDNTEIKIKRNIRNRNLEIIVLTSVDTDVKVEECQAQENNIEEVKENETMNTRLEVRRLENRGVVTVDVKFVVGENIVLTGRNQIVKKFKAEFMSHFHSYKNGVFFGYGNLKNVGNGISVFAELNDCDYYEYLNNDCIVEPLVVTDEVIAQVEELIESVPVAVAEEIEEKVNTLVQAEVVAEPVQAEVVVELNEKLKGVEIKFADKPNQELRAELKACGYRWHAKKELWYAKQNDESMALANRFAPVVQAEPVVKAEPVKVEVVFNEAKKGIEISFSVRPSQEVTQELKACGYRFYKHLNNKWIAKQSNEEAMALAKKCLAPTETKVEEVAPIVVEAPSVEPVVVEAPQVETKHRFKVGDVLEKISNNEKHTIVGLVGECSYQMKKEGQDFHVEYMESTLDKYYRKAEKVNAFALIQEIKAEEQAKVVVSEKKFNALQDRALDKNFISIEDVAENKGAKRSYSSEFNVHSRFLKKILNNPNFLVIRVEKDYFNSESIKHNRELSHFRHQSPMNKFIGEAIEENTKVIADEIMANIEEAKNNKNSHYKGGFDMKIYAPEHKEYRKQMYIQIYTNSMKYFFVSLDFAKVCEEKEAWRSSFLDSRKISDINYHIKNYKDLVILLAELTQENNLFLASWCKQYISQELATIQGIKEAMEKSIQKYDDFKALQYDEALKLEA